MDAPEFVYAPRLDKDYRVAWYGIHSTQLHFQQRIKTFDGDCDFEWRDQAVRTLGNGVPTSVKEMLHEMQEFYDYGMDMELELLQQRL